MATKPWNEYSAAEKKQLMQLLTDMMPFYERVSVYNVDKEFFKSHRISCLRMALAARCVVERHTDVKPEEIFYSDDLFRQMIGEAWQLYFAPEDRSFFQENLQNAAEFFRMGVMMADLPQM